jgi:hypothetical protein
MCSVWFGSFNAVLMFAGTAETMACITVGLLDLPPQTACVALSL